MKQTIEINVPDGYKAVWNAKTNQIDLVKIEETAPKSWEEFCKNYPVKNGESLWHGDGTVHTVSDGSIARTCVHWCTSKEEAKAFVALMKLRQLRKAWVKDWEPNYEYRITESKWIICFEGNAVSIHERLYSRGTLSFPTKTMAEDFIKCFKDLIIEAKILL